MKTIVIGGGIGGLTAGIALRQSKIDAQVYERAPEIGEVGAGLMVASNAMTVLQRLGVAERLMDRCPALENVHISTERGAILTTVPVGEYARSAGVPTLCAHRADLHGALLEAIDDAALHANHEFSRFRQHDDRVEAEFKNDAIIVGDAIVGADGLQSKVRSQVLADGPPRYSGYVCWRGIVDDADGLWSTGHLTEYAGPGLRFGVVNIGGGRVYWYATANRSINCISEATTIDALAEMFVRFTEPVSSILKVTPQERLLLNGCFDRNPVKKWGSGRVTLLGDAAHPTTPNLGQGACQAIEDGWFLARALATGVKVDGALRAYERLRASRTAWIVRQSRRFGDIGQWASPAAVALRTVMMRLTPSSVYRTQYDRLFHLPDGA